MAKDLDGAFAALCDILRPLQGELVTVHDEPGHLYLDAPHVMDNGSPLFFGAVRTGKRYVGFHLMPVYAWPEMLEGMSDELRRRMQGKSCFNFTAAPDPALLTELERLTRSGLERYREAGHLQTA